LESGFALEANVLVAGVMPVEQLWNSARIAGSRKHNRQQRKMGVSNPGGHLGDKKRVFGDGPEAVN
jgi:hypothetical protein